MKNSILTSLVFAGFACGAESTVLTFDKIADSYATDTWQLDGKGNGQGKAWNGSFTLSDGTTASLNLSTGKFWDKSLNGTDWTNEAALSDMNTTLGSNITVNDVKAMKYCASAAGGAKATLTLNFENNAAIQEGEKVVLYYMLSAAGGETQNVTVVGLENMTLTWATAADSGYNTTNIKLQTDYLGLVKIEGTLTANQVITLSSDGGRNGFAMIAYTAIPEPTTATLSLLALAGLAARRRRK